MVWTMLEIPPKDGQFNIGYLCTGAHRDAGRGDRVAMRWLGPCVDSFEPKPLENREGA